MPRARDVVSEGQRVLGSGKRNALSEIQLDSKDIQSASMYAPRRTNYIMHTGGQQDPGGNYSRFSSVRISHYSKGNYYKESGMRKAIHKD